MQQNMVEQKVGAGRPATHSGGASDFIANYGLAVVFVLVMVVFGALRPAKVS